MQVWPQLKSSQLRDHQGIVCNGMKREGSRTRYSASDLDEATGDNSCLVPNAGLPHLSPEWRSGCARYEERVGRGIGNGGEWGRMGREGEEEAKLGEKRKGEERRRCGGVYTISRWLVFFPSHRAGRSIIGCILNNEIEAGRIRE